MKPNALIPHPTAEEWGGYLYDELPPARLAECRQHLEICAECRQAVDGWRATQKALNAWQVPARRIIPTWPAMPRLKWAVAAAVLLGGGLLAGRISAPVPNVEQLRTALVPAIRDELRQEFKLTLEATLASANEQTDRKLDQLAGAWALAHEKDQQATLSLIGEVERQRQADIAWLRRDLETVAVNADAQFNTTSQALGQLASYSPVSANPSGSVTPVNNTSEGNP
jgi:aryl-alcohol dehydrogenase-like predicted oxidoreductase